MNPTLFSYFDEFPERFSIIDFYLKVCDRASIYGYEQADLRLLDVGKQDALEEAESFVKSLSEGEGA
jgi:NDP-sugar pyrophosphorylase family protein